MDQNLGKTLFNISQLFNKLFTIYQEELSLTNIANTANHDLFRILSEFLNLGNDVLLSITKNTDVLKEIQQDFLQELTNLYSNNLIENSTNLPSYFNSTTNWQDHPNCIQLKNFYDLLKKYWLKILDSVINVTPQQKQQLMLYFNNFCDSLVQQNLLFMNHELINNTINSAGQNLLTGLELFLRDLIANDGYLNIKTTDLSAFKLGKNIATTPGAIVYQNDLIELIRYKPTTKQVYQIPILIIPPCINKYYILDLSEENSLVKWLVEQGFLVYMISWVNPGAELAHTDFADYIFNGALKALDFVTQTDNHPKVHLVGYCIGGTLLSCMLSYLKNHNDNRVLSATHFMSLVDFSNLGNMEAFINEPTINLLETITNKKGYLDGRLLNMAFNTLRPNDLIWPYFINHYLLNKPHKAFDILYWNSDATNLPAAMYNFYLRSLCVDNQLSIGKLSLNGTPINLQEITIPIFSVAGATDHITPWKSVYHGATLYNGPAKFVLASSGHIKGLINPPKDHKYSFKINNLIKKKLPKQSNDWLKNAKEYQGSWWPHWVDWLTNLDGQKIDVSLIKSIKQNPSIKNAPGDYVLKKLKKNNEYHLITRI